jgi:eukaryotic-like serine/threonine-protein kinase
VVAPRFSPDEVAAALGGPVSLLGAGSFGQTWRSGDTAVKIICVDGYPPERVKREIGGLTRVSSAHVVRLLSTTAVTLRGQSRPALVFEYIGGGDMAGRITGRDWPTTNEAVALLTGLLTAVADMHDARVLHRDIKPANIILRDGDWARPVLIDLGLARSGGEPTITVYPQPLGTLRYMAPQQLQGHPARKMTDLFAIGVTVREVLGRRHPFHDDDASFDPPYADALARIEKGPYPLPADTPTQVVEVLDHLTAADEHERGSGRSNLRRLRQQGEGSA